MTNQHLDTAFAVDARQIPAIANGVRHLVIDGLTQSTSSPEIPKTDTAKETP